MNMKNDFDKELNLLQREYITKDNVDKLKKKYPGVKESKDGFYRFRGKIILLNDEQKQKALKQLYSEIPPAIGIHRFYRLLINQFIGISRREAEKWLKKQELYQRFKYQLTLQKDLIENEDEDEEEKDIIPKKIGDIVVADCTYMYSRSGKENGKKIGILFNCIDYYSKFAMCYKIKTTSTQETIEKFQNVIKRYGLAGHTIKQLRTDNGPEFKDEFKQFCEKNDIQIKYGEPYNPTDQGLVERFNRTIKRWLKSYMVKNNTDQFEKYIEQATLTYNITKQETTGVEPYLLFIKVSTEEQIKKMKTRILNRQKDFKQFNKRFFEPLEVGDYVRINILKIKETANLTELKKLAKQKQLKKDRPMFSKEVYKITKVLSKRDKNKGYYITSYNENLPLFRHHLQKVYQKNYLEYKQKEKEDLEQKEKQKEIQKNRPKPPQIKREYDLRPRNKT